MNPVMRFWVNVWWYPLRHLCDETRDAPSRFGPFQTIEHAELGLVAALRAHAKRATISREPERKMHRGPSDLEEEVMF